MPILRSLRRSLHQYRNGLVLLVALVVSLSGAWVAVSVTTQTLLSHNAADAALDWASSLAESVPDLEWIAAGEKPSAASMKFFQWARKAGGVFRYKVFSPDGSLGFVSDDGAASEEDEGLSAEGMDSLKSGDGVDAARSARTGQPIVFARHGKGPDQPTFYGEAYVPVMVDGRPTAVIEAYVDQSRNARDFSDTFSIAAVVLILLTAVSFGLPAFALYRRTKEKLLADEQIRFLAGHDPLTGLPNRDGLVEAIQDALGAVGWRGRGLAVHFIDLGRFKEVTDAHGHAGGDFLLRTTAERLRGAIGDGDCVARVFGHEFAVLQVRADSRAEARQGAERLAAALATPLHYRGREIEARFGIGVAGAPADGVDADRLLTCAELASSKVEGRDRIRLFEPAMDAELHARLELERTIRDAVANNRLELHYQPVFESSTRDLVGFEALVRLRAGDGSLIPPTVFIPIAESLLVIDRIGAWVLEEACRTAATWPARLSIAVNLSPAQFEAGSVSATVGEVLKSSGLDPRRLELEVTESLMLAREDYVFAELSKLKEMGVAIVMDDFGTGYSSLSYLWQFPFSKIKIDRGFMTGLDQIGRDAGSVVKTIIALARELKMKVTVEGVETARHAAFITETDADLVQGFFFGRPLPSQEAALLILGTFRPSAPVASTVDPATRSFGANSKALLSPRA